MKNSNFVLVVASVSSTLFSCSTAFGISETIYGVTTGGDLVRWQSDSPAVIDATVSITGLQSGESIVGIDSRPLNATLFGVGSTSRLYLIDPNTGVATEVGSGPFANAINGNFFGYDFNPTIDRSRLVSDNDQNLVLNPNDGASVMVTNLFYDTGDANDGANPNIVHNGYTNSFLGGSTSTTQFAIDSNLDILTTLANNAGTLNTIGSLGININSIGGFDISGATGIAYGAFQLEGVAGGPFSNFYTINLDTGSATLVGEIGVGGIPITAMTVQIPSPGILALFGIAGLSTYRSRRR